MIAKPKIEWILTEQFVAIETSQIMFYIKVYVKEYSNAVCVAVSNANFITSVVHPVETLYRLCPVTDLGAFYLMQSVEVHLSYIHILHHYFSNNIDERAVQFLNLIRNGNQNQAKNQALTALG